MCVRVNFMTCKYLDYFSLKFQGPWSAISVVLLKRCVNSPQSQGLDRLPPDRRVDALQRRLDFSYLQGQWLMVDVLELSEGIQAPSFLEDFPASVEVTEDTKGPSFQYQKDEKE